MVKSISGPFSGLSRRIRVDRKMRSEGILAVNAEPFSPGCRVFLAALTSEVGCGAEFVSTWSGVRRLAVKSILGPFSGWVLAISARKHNFGT